MVTQIVVEWPTAEEEDRTRRFQVNKNYLAALGQHLQDRYGVGLEASSEGLLGELRQRTGFGRIQRGASVDLAACRSALSLSWTGLIQLELASWSQVQFNLPYSNAWAPVHAYYAVYGAARAWLSAQGQLTTSHSGTLKAIGSEVQSRHLYPEPWAVWCTGCCHNRSHSFHGSLDCCSPADPRLLLQTPDPKTFWPRYMKMLETTRRQVLEQRYDDWKQQNGRKRTSGEKKDEISQAVPPTTIFDFLWRLRVRSNYRGVEHFLMTNVPDSWHQEYYEAIRLLTHLSSLLFDCWLAQKIGRNQYGAAVDEFVKYRGSSPEPVQFLKSRKRWLGPTKS